MFAPGKHYLGTNEINLSMPQAIKDQWLAALRSGKYKQGQGCLYNPEHQGYCCLGVLVSELEGGCVFGNDYDPESLVSPDGIDLAYKEKGVRDKHAYTYSAALPPRSWAIDKGFRFDSPADHEKEDDTFAPALRDERGEWVGLDTLNDERGLTFEEIADLIEKQVEGY